MINRIIHYSIHNRLVIVLFTLAIIGGGIYSLLRVPVDAVPDITNNQVQIITTTPNLATEDVERFITHPVEIAMGNLPGLIEIRSISRFGLSLVTVVFKDDMGTWLPRQLVAERLNQIKKDIPKNMGEPYLGPVSTGLGEIYQYALHVDSAHRGEYSLSELRTIQDWIVKRQMAMLPGVVEVNSFGGFVKQFQVSINPDRLNSLGLSMAEIMQAIQRNNLNTGGAYIEKNYQAYFIRGEGLVREIEDLKNISIRTTDGHPLLLRDVAEITDGHAIRYGAFTREGEGESVGGMIMMLKDANSSEVITAVKERIAEIQKSLPEGVSIRPFLDRSELIGSTTRTVRNNLLEGGLIVIFVLVLLLGNWRGGLIVASTIPLSLLFAFILMYVFDVWANLMSLGAIDFGIIVDGAVIIVESTVFYMTLALKKGNFLKDADRKKITMNSASKMMNAAFFGQLIILIVFVPILALEGIEGKMFKPMALTFSFAMIGAMILCLTYVPMVTAWLLRIPNPEKKSPGDKFIHKLENTYLPILKGALKKPVAVVASAVILFALALFTFLRMGGEFIPQLDEGDIAFHAILKPGSSLSEMVKTTTEVERLVKESFPDEVKQIVSKIGVADVPTDPMPMDFADIFLILNPKSEWTAASSKEELIEKLEETVQVLPGVNFEFSQPIEMRFNELISGVRQDIAIKLFGDDLDVLAAKGEELGNLIRDIPGIGDLKVEATTGLPQLTFSYNRMRLARYGLSVDEVNQTIEAAFAGAKAGVFYQGERRFDVVVRFSESYRKDPARLMNLQLPLPNGSRVPFKEIATMIDEPGPMQISRENTRRRTYVGINVRGRDIESVVNDIKDRVDANLKLPPGYTIHYGGTFENLEQAKQRLTVVVPVALALIFILIFFALKSITQTMLIYITIPLAAIGGVFSLWLRDMPFSISAGVGFVVLFGVAVLNGLVLISSLNQLKAEGVSSLTERITLGTRQRIRPILLTASTDILGFMPMALSTSAGAEVQRPLATVVIGGLITATLLTLLVVPVLYQAVEKRKSRGSGFKPSLAVWVVLFSLTGMVSYAQEKPAVKNLSIQDAVRMAETRFPEVDEARFEIEKQKALKKTAWDLGQTMVFTGEEETDFRTEGVQTVWGVQQNYLDPFSFYSRHKLQEIFRQTAETGYKLTLKDLKRRVQLSWVAAYTARERLTLARELEMIYEEFQKAADLRYKNQATSRLEFLAASAQSKKYAAMSKQSEHDYNTALVLLNLYFFSDTLFVPSENPQRLFDDGLEIWRDEVSEEHPLLAQQAQQLEAARQSLRVAQTEWLPKFSFFYGSQEISGTPGYHTYQVGVYVPLSFYATQARVKAQQLEQMQASAALQRRKAELNSALYTRQQNYLKWQKSYNYYRQEAVPLAREQRKAARIAYREGEIDYVTYIQNLTGAVQLEMEYWDIFQNFYAAAAELIFFNEQ